MKKVYQTIIDKGHGNCMQAAIASLLEKELEEVPNFIELYNKDPENYYKNDTLAYLVANGYSEAGIISHGLRKDPSLRTLARVDGGINGYFYAAVPSATHPGGSHAVIVDTDLKVIHDPNPNGGCLNYTPDKVEYLISVNDWVVGIDGSIILGQNYKDYERNNN